MRKTIVALLFVSLLFTSCTQLWFVQPVPQQATNEPEFPEWAIGTFTSPQQVDTLSISKHRYVLLSSSNSSSSIGDSLVVRRFKNYLVINQKLGEHWQPVFLKPNKNGSFDMYAFDVSTEKKMRRLQRKTAIGEDNNGKENIFVANPSDQDLGKMMRSRSFVRFGNFERLRP